MDNTQELDEVSQLLGIYLSEIDVDGSMPTSITRQDLERILDWHNKQVETLLNRIHHEYYEVDEETLNTIIDVELDKLKESSNDQS